MTEATRLAYLRTVLVIVGVVCLALYPLMKVWPSGWAWHVGHSDYALMIVVIYATLGVFLIRASRDPLANISLIWFTVWSSLAHGGLMTVQAILQPEHTGHLLGDIPALLVAALALAALAPRGRHRNNDGATAALHPATGRSEK